MRVGNPFDIQPSGDVLRIDCADCSQQGTSTCDDCVVTFLCDRDVDDAVVFDAEEARALRRLGDAGLAPQLQHRRRTG